MNDKKAFSSSYLYISLIEIANIKNYTSQPI